VCVCVCVFVCVCVCFILSVIGNVYYKNMLIGYSYYKINAGCQHDILVSIHESIIFKPLILSYLYDDGLVLY